MADKNKHPWPILAQNRPRAEDKKKFWSFKSENGQAQLYLYGIIESYSWWGDEITPKNFKSELDGLGDVSELHVYINSDGGDVFAGQAIHTMLKRHQAKVIVHIDGLAASIASVIAMAGDVVMMPRNAMLMVHNPWTYASGNAEQFRKLADDLDNIRDSLIAAYQDKSSIDRDKMVALLDAETWLTAEEAVSYGFADEIEMEKTVAATLQNGMLAINGQVVDLTKYRNAPKIMLAENEKKTNQPERPATRSLSYFEKVMKNNQHRRASSL